MKTIYAIRTANFDDTLYFEERNEALGFIGDQLDMGFSSSIEELQVTEDKFDYLLKTMEVLDQSVYRWELENKFNELSAS